MDRKRFKKQEEFRVHLDHYLIDDFEFPKNINRWIPCPVYGKRPKVWVFNNGRFASCGCRNSKYDNFFVQAESIMSFVKRNNGSALHYQSDELRKNWNRYIQTGNHGMSASASGKW